MTEPLAPGVQVRGTYEIVRPLGQSDLSRVYLARVPDSNTKFVLKEIRPPVDHPRDMERVAQHFERFARAVASLKHPALPRFAEWFVWEGVPFTVREFFDEHSLHEIVLHMKGPPGETQVRGWMAQLCDAFTYLHSQSPPFIYGGLKPQTIGVTPLGKLHVMDYSVPSFLPRELQWKYARRLAPGYVAPEQARGETPTVASDMYNLGALYYFLLTRADPSQYPYVRMRMRVQRPDASDAMLDVLERALAEDPARRFATPEELKAALAPGQAAAPAGAAPEERGFTLDSNQVFFENVKRGDLLRHHLKLKSSSGREVYGKLKSSEPWVRFQFDVFRGKIVQIDFTIETFDLMPGQTYTAVIQVDTDAGVDEIEVIVSMSAPLGMRLTRMVKGLFGG